MATLRANARVRGGIQASTDATTPTSATMAEQETVNTFGLSTSTWVIVLAAGSAAFLFLLYFGHGGTRGSVL